MAGPAIILVKPQLGENIGKAARAMLNFGLDDLRLVAPRDGWPNPDAYPAASGADHVLDNAKTFNATEEAIKDLTHVFAATVRGRGIVKPVVDARAAGKTIRGLKKGKVGILFGREAAGLSNEDVVLADTILTVPVNPEFGSLNLAVAVGVIAYECFAGEGIEKEPEELPAAKEDMVGLFEHLEGALDEKGYFHPPERKGVMVLSLRNLLQSANLTRQKVQTLRGIIKALAGKTRN